MTHLLFLCVVRDSAVAHCQNVDDVAVEPHEEARTMLTQPAVQVLSVDAFLSMHL